MGEQRRVATPGRHPGGLPERLMLVLAVTLTAVFLAVLVMVIWQSA